MWCVSSLALVALLSVVAAAQQNDGFGDATLVASLDEAEMANLSEGSKVGDVKKGLVSCLYRAGISRGDIKKMDDARNSNFGIYVGPGPRSLSRSKARRALYAIIHCFARGRDNTAQCCSRISDKCKVLCDDSSPEKYKAMSLYELLRDCSAFNLGYTDAVLSCHMNNYVFPRTVAPRVTTTAAMGH